ncbi:glycosyltransferase [Geomesophilobacter sediminis]|uniref:Glycosyltransferase n=1 Tax=Geomesophilobacter sediminis TaxID=2798584 RepID=A0A8J7JGP2_9BACT|nr:glycosyltransferase [Geomesophilobacter sediminis]MBJ6723675.1 glycosyltransferase [Geomesophilobacter sediminis]
MRRRVLIAIDTLQIGGPGKGLLQFLRCGGMELCDPVLLGFPRVGIARWPFGEAVRQSAVKFEAITQRGPFDLSTIPKAHAVIKKHRIEILQSHGYKAHLVFFFLKRLTGLPWVAYVHGDTAENWKIKLYNRLEKALLRFADRVVVVSDQLKSKLDPKLVDSNRVRTIKNAIEPPPPRSPSTDIRSAWGLGTDDLAVAVVGRFSPEKGQLVFIEALALVRERLKNVKGLLIGDGQDKELLQARARELGVEDALVFTGFQSDVAPYYDAADLVVLPSFSEGMPNVALEAMMFGKPVVASRVGGVPEVVVDGVTGRLVPARDPRRLAEAILAVLADPRLCAEYGQAGKKRVLEEFDPYRRAEQMTAVYAQL